MATDQVTILYQDASGGSAATKLRVDESASAANIATYAAACQAASDLEVIGSSRVHQTTYEGDAPQQIGTLHPFADNRAAMNVEFMTAQPGSYVQFSIPAPETSVDPSLLGKTPVTLLDDMRIAADDASLADLIAAVNAYCLTSEGLAITTCMGGRISA